VKGAEVLISIFEPDVILALKAAFKYLRLNASSHTDHWVFMIAETRRWPFLKENRSFHVTGYITSRDEKLKVYRDPSGAVDWLQTEPRI
jgi:hypothetical protein